MARGHKYYEWLGITPDATEVEIKKAYRKLALQYHPDKNPTPEAAEKFREVAMAYETLGNEEKRKEYDCSGDQQVDTISSPAGQHAESTMSPEDVFAHFFGGTFSAGSTWKIRGDDVGHALPVTLEDLYLGRPRKVALNKQVICQSCGGTGYRLGGVPTTCQGCAGKGTRLVTRRLGPGLVQQMQTTCSLCKGEGTAMATADVCIGCSGRRVQRERKILLVPVEQGMKHHYTIPFPQEGDQHPDINIPGDIVIVLKEQPHKSFVRRGQNLCTKKAVSCAEAQSGFTTAVVHLDGRELQVQCAPGEVWGSGFIKVVTGEGWPRCRHPGEKGDLLIEFTVEDT
eukprot:GGOE01049504.1.p1 GENE.GGOE01049504.1~~GGOE01049504.1.p1  ORF type:complete len:341 (-),score=85.78 GGOE01049504.1:177-1199(-)